MSFKITGQELRDITRKYGKPAAHVNDAAPVVDRLDVPQGGVRLTREQMAGKTPKQLIELLDSLAEKQAVGIPADASPDTPQRFRSLEDLLFAVRGGRRA
jgi:hypothetical protein